MTETKVGKYTVVVELADKNEGLGKLNRYDVICYETNSGLVLNVTGGCLKMSEQGVVDGMWYKRMIEFAERYGVLRDALDMVYHNMLCYSKTLLMKEPKDGYEEEYAGTKDKERILREMINKLVEDYGAKPSAEV